MIFILFFRFESQHIKARLDSGDANFVDVIHSNGENLILGGLGMLNIHIKSKLDQTNVNNKIQNNLILGSWQQMGE